MNDKADPILPVMYIQSQTTTNQVDQQAHQQGKGYPIYLVFFMVYKHSHNIIFLHSHKSRACFIIFILQIRAVTLRKKKNWDENQILSTSKKVITSGIIFIRTHRFNIKIFRKEKQGHTVIIHNFKNKIIVVIKVLLKKKWQLNI